MDDASGGCPMSRRELIDEYFMENRHRLLDLAAFLDRLDRADGAAWEGDFRMAAFLEAVRELSQPGPGRTQRVHMVFSDPTQEPKERLDQKAALGAWDPAAPRG
jgi:hypothetical protein